MMVGIEGSIVQTTALPEGSLTQITPGPVGGGTSFPGKCDPSAVLSAQQEQSGIDLGGWFDKINAWVNNNTLMALGVVAGTWVVMNDKLKGRGK